MPRSAPAQPPRLQSERLTARLATQADVPAVVRYFNDNRDHLRPFEPHRPPAFFEAEFWCTRVRQDAAEFHADRSLRLFLFPRDDPARVVGLANFTQFARGVFHACSLGYSVARELQGQGLMREALETVIPYLFGTLRMHRIQANYMPHNRRSGRLLRRLGFVVEGYARDYLLIDGRWEDHVLTSLTNPDWSPEPPTA